MTSLVAPFDAYKGNEPYIFVSYAHRNSDIVFDHIVKLHEAGFRIWYDEGIDPGTDWSDEIALALNNAACFLVFMSPEAAGSHNVKKEIVFAVGKKKHMVCVYIAETELPLGLEMQLGNIQGIPEARFIDKNKFYERFMNALPVNTRGGAIENGSVGGLRAKAILEAVPAASLPAPVRSGDFEITGTVLTRYLGSAKVLTIPDNVTAIGPQAFAECRSLESVVIPDGVRSIGGTAFVNCVNLRLLFIPKTMTSIAYGAFTNCGKLTVKCWRSTPSHHEVQKAWRGPVEFLDDAHRPPVSSAAPAPAQPVAPASPSLSGDVARQDVDVGKTGLPLNTAVFVPKGTAVITMRDGTRHTAIANTLHFVSGFEGCIGTRLYQGLDEKSLKAGYKCEGLIFFEDMTEFTVDLSEDKASGKLNITDCDGEQQTKKLTDMKEELWFISPELPTDITAVPLAETARVVFHFRSAPSCSLPMALIERKERENLLVPQAFVRLHIGDYSRTVPDFYWSAELPLADSGRLSLKRIKVIEVNKVIRESGMFQPYTEVELTVEKRNGERLQDRLNAVFTLYVLMKTGLASPPMGTIHRITFNFTTINHQSE